MNVRLRDIADKLGLSHTTVSRVLNNCVAAKVSNATREKIIAVANEMGYRSNNIARALVTGTSHIISLWSFNIYTSYYIGVLRKIREHVISSGYHTLLVETNNDPSIKPEPWGYWWPVDAVIAFDSPLCIKSFLETPVARKMPIVSMGGSYSSLVDYVGVDLSPGAVEAVRHLVKKGCRRIAYFATSSALRAGEARYDAYMRVMRASRLQPEFIEMSVGHGTYERPAARQRIKDYFHSHGKPEAIFCYNDDMAIAVYRGMKDVGVRVPDDVLLIGCDDIEDGRYLDAPISTITYPIDDMVKIAMDFLLRRMSDLSCPKQEKIIKSNFIARASSGDREGENLKTALSGNRITERNAINE